MQDKSKLITYIVAAGLTYGQGEGIFHFMFKSAWHGGIPYLPVYGDGQNFVPTIHVWDLARYLKMDRECISTTHFNQECRKYFSYYALNIKNHSLTSLFP